MVEVGLLSHAKLTTFRKLVINFLISLGFSLVWWNVEFIGIQIIDFVLVGSMAEGTEFRDTACRCEFSYFIISARQNCRACILIC